MTTTSVAIADKDGVERDIAVSSDGGTPEVLTQKVTAVLTNVPPVTQDANSINVYPQVHSVMYDATEVNVAFAAIDTATSGDNTLVSVAAGFKVRVLDYLLVCAAADSTPKWKTGATAKSGALPFAANGGAFVSAPTGLFEGADGEDLILNLAAATQVSGHVAYVLIPTA